MSAEVISRGLGREGGVRVVHTNIVIESNQGSREFYKKGLLVRVMGGSRFEVILPFSPFMMTQMRDPTHLSMSSAAGLVSKNSDQKKKEQRLRRCRGPYRGVEVEMP